MILLLKHEINSTIRPSGIRDLAVSVGTEGTNVKPQSLAHQNIVQDVMFQLCPPFFLLCTFVYIFGYVYIWTCVLHVYIIWACYVYWYAYNFMLVWDLIVCDCLYKNLNFHILMLTWATHICIFVCVCVHVYIYIFIDVYVAVLRV